MFDTMMIAKRIKDARIAKNMTQMNLADELGVSYQAVSNWERGNSMPDISKLGDLCTALDLTVDELLGVENNSTATVNKIMQNEEVTPEELAEVAPILPPADVQQRVKKITARAQKITEEVRAKHTSKMEKLSQKLAIKIGGKLPPEFTEEIEELKKAKRKINLAAIAGLAPFLDKEYLNELVVNADLSDLDGLPAIAPFLRKETLDDIAERASAKEMRELVSIAPFLSKQRVESLILRCLEEDEGDLIPAFAPFVSRGFLNDIVNTMIEEEYDPDDMHWVLSDFNVFLSKETLHKLAKYMLEQDVDPDDIEEFL